MKTIVTWIDHKRVMVETPQGDDFIVGFHGDSNYWAERNSYFKITHDLGLLFDKFYKGESSVIMGDIYRSLLHLCYQPVFFFQKCEKTEKDDERIRIGQRIKELRLKKGWDAKTLAAVAGIDAANLCRIEAGKYSVGFDILAKIAKVCGKKIDFINNEEEGHECVINLCEE